MLILQIAIILLVLSSTTLQIISQSPTDYGAHYKVKKGDGMEYEYTKTFSGKSNILSMNVVLSNQSDVIFNVTSGDHFIVKVINVNETVSGVTYTNVYSDVTYNTGNKKYTSAVKSLNNYLMEAFDSKTMVDKYVDAVNTMNANQNNPSESIHYHDDATYLYTVTNQSFSNNLTVNAYATFNWASGWLTYWYTKVSVGNVTYSELEYESISSFSVSNSSANIFNILLYILIVGIPVTIIGVIVYYFSKYN